MFCGLLSLPVLTVLAILAGASTAVWADGEGSLRAPNEIIGTEILDKRGAQVPLDVRLINHRGEKVLLGSYFGEKPIVLTLGYYQCPMLCNLVLNGLIPPMKDMSLKMGDDFTVLSVSINPSETAELGKNKRSTYLKALGLDDGAKWHFHVGEEAEVRKLADAVGFQYKLHKPSGEYVHSAGIFILSPEGVLSRTLYGINYKASDLKMSLIDAAKGNIGSLLDRVILSCFHYDPDSHKYGVYVFGVMRIGGLLTILILGIFLVFHWRNENRARSLS